MTDCSQNIVLKSILSKIRHILFDMDGTIYSGGKLFPYTKQAFAILENIGISYTYLTNNSSISAADYFVKIRSLGLNGDAECIFTSSLATLAYLKKHYPAVKSLFILGTDSIKTEFRNYGYEVIETEDTDCPDAVIAAFDTSLTYEKYCKAAWCVKQGIPYIATHPDKICPTDKETILIDCGSLTEGIAAATGRQPDKVAGKPDAAMIEGILQKHNLRPDETAMVGDRLYTDIETARRTGTVGVLVLSGETTAEDLEKSSYKPELVVDNILVFAQMLEKTHG